MHIPNGFLDVKTVVSTTLLSAGALAYSIRQTKQELEERQVPLLGVMAAFIFAAQMVNFPVAGGTSGHLLGAALATILLGPWSASLIITTVLIIQCLFFQDGGLTALGANIFNMAVMAPLAANFIYHGISKVFTGKRGQTVGVFAAAWFSVVTAALAAAVELAISGTAPLAVVLPAMLGWHILIGVGEGLISTVVVAFVLKQGIVSNKINEICEGVA